MIDDEEEENPAWEYLILAEQAHCCGTRSARGPQEPPVVNGRHVLGILLTQ